MANLKNHSSLDLNNSILNKKKTVLSGIQPTNKLHIGNYLGAIKQWVELVNQADYNYIFMIVDMHAITVAHDPVKLKKQTLQLAALYLASGLDPERCILFVQSHNPDHAYLSWILETQTPYGWLTRMTQFKDKKQKLEKFDKVVSTGLFTYPVLMAADILLYDTDLVPVGEDQVQHVELARDIAKRFNKLYKKKVFVVPQARLDKAAVRVKDLSNPTKKMSKSAENDKGVIWLTDSPDIIKKKVQRAVTDNIGKVNYDPQRQPGVTNLLEIVAAFTGKPIEQVVLEFSGATYAQFKQRVSEVIIEHLVPIQERYRDYIADKAALLNILRKGAERARNLSYKKIEQVKEAIGFVSLAG